MNLKCNVSIMMIVNENHAYEKALIQNG